MYREYLVSRGQRFALDREQIEQPLSRQRQRADVCASRVRDGVGDGRCRTIHGQLTNAFGTRRTVCATDLYVRDSPQGIFIGTLYKGQTLEVTDYSPSGAWAYGFAYGNVNKWGWVQNGWFCN